MLVRRQFAGGSRLVALFVCIAHSPACNEHDRTDTGSGASEPAAAGSARATEIGPPAENAVDVSHADAAGRGGDTAKVAVPDGPQARDAGTVPAGCEGYNRPEVLVESGVNGMRIALTEKDVYWASGSQVFRTPKGGGSSQAVHGASVGGRAPTIDSNRLYWGGEPFTVYGMPLDTAECDPNWASVEHRWARRLDRQRQPPVLRGR